MKLIIFLLLLGFNAGAQIKIEGNFVMFNGKIDTASEILFDSSPWYKRNHPQPKYDTVPVVMLVSDTCFACPRSNFYDTDLSLYFCFSMKGYEVRKKYESVTVYGTDMMPTESPAIDILGHDYSVICQLDSEKNKLKKSIIVWQTR